MDTTNINAAIQALPAAGGRLVFQSGTYVMNSAITFPAHGIVEGMAPSTLPDEVSAAGTILSAAPNFAWSDGRMVDATAADNLQIRNLVITSQSSLPNPDTPNACCLAVANNVHLQNVLIRNVHSVGANYIWGLRQVGGGNWVTADHLFVINCDGGARFDNATNVLWKQSYLGNSLVTHNLQIVRTPANTNSVVSFEPCLIDEVAGIVSALVNDCQDVTFADCLFYANEAVALYDQGTRTKLTKCKLLAFGTNTGVVSYLSDGGSDCVLQNCFLKPSVDAPAVALVNNGVVLLDHCTIDVVAGMEPSTGVGMAVFRNCPGVNPRGDLGASAPGIPASGTPLRNDTGFDVMVYVTGGAVESILIDRTATGLTSGSFRLPVGQTITLNYTAAPSWKWLGD